MLYSLIYKIMKRTLVSVIILVVAFFAITGVAANGTIINLDSGDGVEYLLCAMVYIIMSLCAAYYFQNNRKKCVFFTILSWGMPLIFGIAAFIVAAFFTLFIVPFTDDKVLAWFKSIAEPDKDCENE